MVITRRVGWRVRWDASLELMWRLGLSVMSRGTSEEKASEVYVFI